MFPIPYAKELMKREIKLCNGGRPSTHHPPGHFVGEHPISPRTPQPSGERTRV